jgi:hypothetical protein
MGKEGINILNDVDYTINTMCSIEGKSREFYKMRTDVLIQAAEMGGKKKWQEWQGGKAAARLSSLFRLSRLFGLFRRAACSSNPLIGYWLTR